MEFEEKKSFLGGPTTPTYSTCFDPYLLYFSDSSRMLSKVSDVHELTDIPVDRWFFSPGKTAQSDRIRTAIHQKILPNVWTNIIHLSSYLQLHQMVSLGQILRESLENLHWLWRTFTWTNLLTIIHLWFPKVLLFWPKLPDFWIFRPISSN